MSYVPHITDKAESNLKDICNYLVDVLHSPKAKETFIAALDKKLTLICKMPTSCQICEYPPLALHKIRYALVKKYKLYFWVDDGKDIVHVLYIRHQLQNEKDLSEDE